MNVTCKNLLPTLLRPAAENKFIRRFIAARTATLSRFTPRGFRPRHTDRRSTFTTTMRVIIRVHGRTADCRSNTHMPLATGLTELDIALLYITNLANRGQAVLQYIAFFTRRQAQGYISADYPSPAAVQMYRPNEPSVRHDPAAIQYYAPSCPKEYSVMAVCCPARISTRSPLITVSPTCNPKGAII